MICEEIFPGKSIILESKDYMDESGEYSPLEELIVEMAEVRTKKE